MKKIKFITKKFKLEFDKQSTSVSEIDLENMVKTYSAGSKLDIKNYNMVVINDELVVTFALKMKKDNTIKLKKDNTKKVK